MSGQDDTCGNKAAAPPCGATDSGPPWPVLDTPIQPKGPWPSDWLAHWVLGWLYRVAVKITIF